MPGMNGLDLLERCRRFFPGMRVIVVTGFASTQWLADAIRLGAYDYMEKPLAIDEVVEAVRAAVEDFSPGALTRRAAHALQVEARLGQAPFESIHALVHTVEAKDPYTRRHSEQVTHYAMRLAEYVGLPTAMVESVRVAALLHDIGKIGIPDRILTKPGPLTPGEMRLVQRHPDVGASIVENISMFQAEASLVRGHHENWDGSGYPQHLAGDDIPLGARVIKIADCIDAMLMRRTYKEPFSFQRMIDGLTGGTGTQFDPDLTVAAIHWCRAHLDQMILAEAA
jgi:putative nucleotidyltransferase with HDIG domain